MHREAVGESITPMSILEDVVQKIGPLLRPFHAGEDKLVSRRLGPSVAASIQVTSDAFTHGDAIPRRYAQEGDDVSPPLRWANLPDGTREIVLLCEDPDAPFPSPFSHWVVYAMAPATEGLPENVAKIPMPHEERMRQGKNGAKGFGYVGAAPPPGHGVHRYHFQVFAVDAPLAFEEAPDRDELAAALEGHVLAYGDLVGTYERT